MRKYFVILIILALVLSTGCIFGSGKKKTTAPKVYVTPCNVIGSGIRIRVVGEELTTANVVPELKQVLIDDFTADWAESMERTAKFTCYWGQRRGQSPEYYYCDMTYAAPDLSPDGKIKRHLWKTATVGFKVEKHEIGSYIDLSGKKVSEGTYYYLTFKEQATQCWVA